MSHKMSLIVFFCLMFFAASAPASEAALYNNIEDTFTIPIVNVDDQSFYYLELRLSESENRFNIKDAWEIGSQNNSDGYFSTATSRLSLANVDMDGGQWIINLDLTQDSSQFMVESMFLPTLDAAGNISEVEYIDNALEHFIYRFNEALKIDHIETERFVYSFQADGSVNVYANYGAPNYGTHLGDLNADELSSSISLYYFFRWVSQLHHSEITSSQEDYAAINEVNINYRSVANALSIPSWLFACASATVSTNSWETVVKACEAPAN